MKNIKIDEMKQETEWAVGRALGIMIILASAVLIVVSLLKILK